MENVRKQLPKVVLMLLFVLTSLAVQAKNKTISGKVTDNKNEPLIGVAVTATGTTIGTITDVSGAYSISVPEGQATLQYSYLGFITVTEDIGGRTEINIVMEEDVKKLEEIVVVGYGVMKKRDLTGAVASLKQDQIAAIPVSNVAQALQGRLAGVNVISQDGRPDASISIRVRGGGSVSQSNDPLFIVDGFPVSSISNIPGSQIESIDVLKDASSTAIYGARGANGVIIITTKSGKSGKIKVSYDGFGKFNVPTKYLPTMNAYDYIAYNWAYASAISDSYANGWEMLWGIGRHASAYNNTEGIDHYKNVGAKNYSKEAYGSSFSQNHSLNISGGNDNTKFLIGVNQTDEDGMKVNSWYKRTNATFKIDQKLSNRLSISLDTRYVNVSRVGNEGTTNGQGSILSSSYWFRPIATADVLGELNDSKNTAIGLYDNYLQDLFNPVSRIKDFTPKTKERSLVANTGLNWKIGAGFNFRSELGLSAYWNKTNTWSGAIFNNYYNAAGEKTYGGNASIASSEGWSARWVNTLNYEVQGLGKNHNLTILAGQEISDSGSESITINGSYYPVSFDAERAFAMMNQYRTSTGTTNYFSYSSNVGTPSRMQSYFGRVNYSLLDKYLFTATYRADGSSRFAPTHRWGYFPAAAFGWRLSEEGFVKNNLVWVDNLKLRVSYGSVGNDGISANLWKMNWQSDGLVGWSINESQQPSYSPASTTIANPDLMWETTITRNLGLDFGFFKNKIYGSAEVYWNSTNDLLMLTNVPTISGFTSTYDNVGSTSNKGLEISVGTDIVRSKDFNLSANLNVNVNKGKIESLAEGVNGLYRSQWGSSMTQPNTGDYVLKEGEPVGLVRGYVYDGWYTVDDFTFANGKYTLKEGIPDIGAGIIGTVYGTTALKPAGQVAYPGVMKLKDTSGDGVVNESDVDIIGNTNPKHTGGLNIQGNFKNLDFQMGFNWSYGNKLYNANYLASFYGSKEDGLFRNRLNYLSSSYKIYDIQNGQIASVTDPTALSQLNANATTFLPYHENPVVSTLGIQDGSYLRLNTITMGYTLPQSLLRVLKISKIRLYGTIYNAYTWTNYPGLDPEVSTNTNQGNAQYPTTGLDWGAYPRARSFVFGLNVEF